MVHVKIALTDGGLQYSILHVKLVYYVMIASAARVLQSHIVDFGLFFLTFGHLMWTNFIFL